MVKQFYFILLFLLIAVAGFSQSDPPYSTLQRVIPPTPEAVSLGQVGFSDVNLYTGKASYSLPVYTVSQNGINFPISLSYTGGGGIKVEEVGSSVGLGWNFSSTGVVTRVIRGVADDTYAGNYIGYIHLGDFPPVEPASLADYKKYAANKYDGQPDLFSVSVAGVSAQFYINKNKKVVFVEKSDLKVTPTIVGYAITAFTVKDMYGRTYYFSEQEKSKSEPVDNTYAEYDDYNTTSWYLTKITSEYGKDIISFTYLSAESNPIKQEVRSPYQYSIDVQSTFSSDNSSNSYLFYKRPVLQKINFAAGEVSFKMSDSLRYDMADDRYLKSVTVKNYLGDTVKHFNFHYSYFSTTGSIQQGQGSHSMYGNSALRLRLDSLREIPRSGGDVLAYKFTYDTSHFLPDRLTTFAMDHWGYYNGKTTNTGWEAKNRVKYYNKNSPLSSLDSSYKEFGTADREPNLTYAKAAVLEKAVTPAGGVIDFKYELNSSADAKLRNTLQTSNFFSTLDYTANYFGVSLINEPFSYVKVSSTISNSYYSYEYILSDSLQTTFYVLDTLKFGDAEHIYKLEKGTYFVKVQVLGAHPDTAYQYFARVFVENEVLIPNKPVGGLRIRYMKLTDPAAGTNLQRNYFYNEAGDTSTTSLSTGEISGVPRYGIQRVELFASDYEPNYFSAAFIIPHGYTRMLTSAYPVGVTAGSFVGYRKVTVVDSNALKTESYFTGFKDFPEFSEGYFPDYDPSFDETTISGKTYETSPFAPYDERDYLRGKLTKQVIYKKENGVFTKIQQSENVYQFNMGFVVDKHTFMLPDTLEIMKGMVFNQIPNVSDPDNPFIHLKTFNLYTSRYDLKKTIEKQYIYQGGTDSLVTETNIEYGDSPWFRDSLYHYQPTKVTKKLNTGTETSKIYYPYDWRYTVPGASGGEEDDMKTLEAANRIAIPVLQVTEDSATGYHISSVKNTYDELVNGLLAANIIKTKQGSSSYEDRISFNRYDTLGNLVEQQKINDIKSSFIRDYKNSYPIAEVSNADSTSVAYSSFEADGKGNWTYSGTQLDTLSVTGKKAYKLNGSNNVSKTGLTSGSVYIVSYWTRNSSAFSITGTQSGYPISGRTVNGWKYFEHRITGQTTVTLTGSGWIDELRLYPEKALMSTLTYDPLTGISSTCDANNRISYYEYDAFNRLSLVWDQDKNILKRICYNYAGQPENCNYYYSAAVSDTFTRNNCSTGYTGSNVIYTVSANRYSSAISQADANLKAVNDLNANGQAYANTNGTCTENCNSSNCTGNNKKCINNVCETGVKVYTDTYWDAGLGKWVCTYHYEWSDNSWSQDYTELSKNACPI